MSQAYWIILPLVGALIGFATNWLAVQMLFHPREKRFGIQGLLPRRQQEFAGTVAEVVSGQLVEMEDLLSVLDAVDLRAEVAPLLDQAIEQKVDGIRERYPMLKHFLDEERVAQWRTAALDEVDRYRPQIFARIKAIAAERIDVRAIAFDKLGGQDILALEGVVRTIAKKEFRAIELWGALLGLTIGLIQAGLLAAIA